MGLIPVEEDAGLRTAVGAPRPPDPAPGLEATIGAAFRQDNTIVSLLTNRAGGTFQPVEGYNPMNDPQVSGTRYARDFATNFIGSGSPEETAARISQIDGEEKDRAILAASGALGTVAQIAAGIIDPTIALPAGTIYRGARVGTTIARSALSVGAAGAAAAGAAELVLQGSQETRTLEESGIAVASGAILSGILGAGAAALLTRAELRALSHSLDAERVAIEAHASGQPAPVGAAAADTRELRPVASGLNRATERFDPLSRVFGSNSVSARRTVADLAEVPTRFEENLAGVPTTSGPALERMVRLEIAQTRVALADEFDRLFSQYRFGAPDTTAPRLRAQWERFRGTDAGKMTYAEFKQEVGRALQEGDQHVIPEVGQAAQFLRQRVFNPWFERAKAAGLLPDAEGGVAGAESYFHRVYNKQAIVANRPDFVNRVTDWLSSDQATKAAAKERLQWYNGQLRSWNDQIRKFEARMERLQARRADIESRFDELGRQIARSEKRGDVLTERAASVTEEISDIEEFIAAMRSELTAPEFVARLNSMERDLSALRRADRPVTEAQVRALEKEELQSALVGLTRKAAEILVGRRKWPKAPSFVSWLVSNGGIKDTGGDVFSVVGGKRVRAGLINDQGRSLDQWGEKLYDEFKAGFPNGRPLPQEVLRILDAAMRGRDPIFWLESFSDAERELVDAAKIAAGLDEMLTRAGVEVKKISDVARFLRDGRIGEVTLDDLDRIAAEMEAAGESVPVAIRRGAIEDEIAVSRETIAGIRGLIDRARRSAAARAQRIRTLDARGQEVAAGETAISGRMGALLNRTIRAEAREQLITDALEMAGRMRDEVRGKIEAEIGAWEGKSAAEGRSAIKAREKYAADTGRPADEPRLRSADDAVDRVVRRIIDSDRDLSVDELRGRANEITDRILGSPDGRLPYDIHTGGPEIGWTGPGGEAPRGALARREFAIPDATLREGGYLEMDAEHVAGLYLRTMAPDVLLTERFGDTRMTEAFKKINDDYARMAEAATSAKQRTALDKERNAVIRDVAAMRDRIRAVYGFDPKLRNAARVANAVKNYNVLTSMGVAALSSLPDMAGPVFRHGLVAGFRDAWLPFFRGLTRTGEGYKAARAQFKAMGIASEAYLGSRAHALADVMDEYRPNSRVERALQYGADRFMMFNLLTPWTDWAKNSAAMVASAEIFRAVDAVAKGKATKRQLANLAENGIDANLALRIHEQFLAASDVIDGVRVPNTADWTNAEARAAFEGAIGREADIAVITPGQEKPLWLSHPVLSVFGQFKSFMASATQRILIANLQRRDAQVLQGLIFSLGLGMVTYKLNSLTGGQPTSDKPQDWIKEAISRGGLLGWFEEGNALASKASRGSVDMYRMIGSNKPLSRYASRSALDQIIGPTAGKLGSILQVTGAAGSAEWKESDTKAVRRLLATQNLFYVRRLFDEVERGVNNAFGVEMKARAN